MDELSPSQAAILNAARGLKRADDETLVRRLEELWGDGYQRGMADLCGTVAAKRRFAKQRSHSSR